MKAACIKCGHVLESLEPTGICSGCGMPYSCRGGVLDWTDGNLKAHRMGWVDYLKVALDPMANPWSPPVLHLHCMIEDYYRRVLNDRSLAARFQEYFLDGLNLSPGMAVLDHGGGRGRISALMRLLGYRVCCQEIYRHPWWKKLEGVAFQVVPETTNRLPWGDASFDSVLDFQVVGYFTPDKLAELAAEVWRVLKPGGVWIIWEANRTAPGAYASKSFLAHVYCSEEIRDIATTAGFNLIDCRFDGASVAFLPRVSAYIRSILRPGRFDFFSYGAPFKIPGAKRNRCALMTLRLQKERER